MFNKQALIFFTLITLTLQDNNCLVNFEYCEEEEEPEKTLTIKNCKEGYVDDDNEYCFECETNYYVSEDRKSCIQVKKPIDNCISYYSNSGNEFCDQCGKGYARSVDYKSCTKLDKPIENCVRLNFISESEYECNQCEEDYYTSYDGKSCIEFKNCRNFINNEENEHCEYCRDGYALSYGGKSCIPSETCRKLAEGDKKCSECIKYFHRNANGECERTLCEEYDGNVCKKCYGGYYLDADKNCQKITIDYCLELDDANQKCKTCLFEASTDANGKCILPSQLIKGCKKYNNDGKCAECEDEGDIYELKEGTCKFIECKNGKKYEYCNICKVGYYRDEDENDNYICIGYDGSRDTSSSDSSSSNKVEYALLIFILALLI